MNKDGELSGCNWRCLLGRFFFFRRFLAIYEFVLDGAPKINIVGAQEFGEIKVLLDEDKQIMFSPAPMVRKMKRMLKDFSDNDYLLLTGDPAMIGVACSVVSNQCLSVCLSLPFK